MDPARMRLAALFCGVLLGTTALAPSPAAALVGVFVGGLFGAPAYYYPPYYYYPPVYYYPRPTVYGPPPAYTVPPPPYGMPPPPPAHGSVPPSAAPATKPTPHPAATSRQTSRENCRQFETTTNSANGGAQPGHFTACQQPDGSWRIVN